MKLKSALGVFAVVVSILSIVLIAVVLTRSNPDIAKSGVASSSEADSTVTKDHVVKTELSEVLRVPKDDFVPVGGVLRPKRDIAFPKPDKEIPVSKKSVFAHPGNAKAAAMDANSEVAGLHQELSGEDRGPREARSALFKPADFDPEKYAEDPSAWLSKIRPGRVFHPAQPTSEVKPIATKTPGFQKVLQGEKVILEAQVSPNAPVSFYTPQVGFFENQLKSQSVAANEDGVARVVYTAGPGTNGVVDIVAASPVHSGQLRYRVKVSLPQTN